MKMIHGLIFIAILLFLGSIIVSAKPEGPDTINIEATSTRTATGYRSLNAIAGNVTQLTIVGTSTTQSWAGYYGNISGTIALDSASGKRMYSWQVANPKGEIYATEATSVPTWGAPGTGTNINCWNYSEVRCKDAACFSYAEIEGWETDTDGAPMAGKVTVKGIKQNSVDSINNTFRIDSDRTFPSFFTGTKFINGTNNMMGCPSIALYNFTNESTYSGPGDMDTTDSDGSIAGGKYQEVILEDNVTNATIYTAIIDFERITPGFDGTIWDFEMLVPEKGTKSDTSTTTYNFYVELE